MKAKTIWIIVLVLAAVTAIIIYRRNRGSASSGRFYCGGSDIYGHNIYTGGACQTSPSGSYSVSSGGNGIWAYGNKGCYCNTNAMPTAPVSAPPSLYQKCGVYNAATNSWSNIVWADANGKCGAGTSPIPAISNAQHNTPNNVISQTNLENIALGNNSTPSRGAVKAQVVSMPTI